MKLEKFADEFGPEMTVEVYNSRVGLKSVLVDKQIKKINRFLL